MNKELLKKKLLLLRQIEELYHKRHSKYEQMQLLTNREHILSIKKEIAELDHTLDLLSDDEDRSPEELLKEIIEELILSNPSYAKDYKPLEEEHERQCKAKEELEQLAFFINKYSDYFKKCALLLTMGKKRSLLALLLGRHPKVLLSYEITMLAKEAHKDIPILESILLVDCAEAKQVQQKSILLLEQLITEAHKKWNSALYEEAFQHFLTHILQVKEEIEHLLQKNKSQASYLHQKTENWLSSIPT